MGGGGGGRRRRAVDAASPLQDLGGRGGDVLFAAVLLYPILATPARIRDRFDLATPTGLDGERYLDLAVFHEAAGKIPLRDDEEAFAWLRRSVVGSPVVLEASVPPYRWGSRVSVYTGLPTVIGWDWHQRQQRSVAT